MTRLVSFRRPSPRLAFLALTLGLLGQACVTGPYDGQRVSSRSSSIRFSGYTTQANSEVTVQALNQLTNTWEDIGTVRSGNTKFTLADDVEIYSWNLGERTLANKYWRAGKSGYYAQVRGRNGQYGMFNVVENYLECLGLATTTGWQDQRAEGCFSHRDSAYIYTQNYSVAALSCPEASGSTVQGHYMLDDLPTCAQDNIYGWLSDYISDKTIADHYEIDHSSNNAGSTKATNGYEVGGAFGGHKRYIRRAERYVGVHSYSWTPDTKLPAYDSNTTIPTTYRQPKVSPNGNCRSTTCDGWDSTPVSDPTPQRPKPSNLQAGNVCATADDVEALWSATSGWHGGVHIRIGGAFGNMDSPSNPLFFMWHQYVNDVWEDWKDCP